MITEEDANKIALFLFIHKWLAIPYSEGNLALLTAAIMQAAKDGPIKSPCI